MKSRNVVNIINVVLPVIGIGLMIYYNVCNTSCSSLKGTLLGIDLKIIGIIFMASLLIINLVSVFRNVTLIGHLRTIMLSVGIGGEVILIWFQVMHNTYCPFCLAFGMCILILFAVNFIKMNRSLAFVSFLAGLGVFALFFNGSILPLYG